MHRRRLGDVLHRGKDDGELDLLKQVLCVFFISLFLVSTFAFYDPASAAAPAITQTFATGPPSDTYHSNRNYFVCGAADCTMGGARMSTFTTILTLTGPLSGTATGGGNWSEQVNTYAPSGYRAALNQFVVGCITTGTGTVGLYFVSQFIQANDLTLAHFSGTNSSNNVKSSLFTAGATLSITLNANATGNIVSAIAQFVQANGKTVWFDSLSVTTFNANGVTGNAQTPVVGLEVTLIGDSSAHTSTFTKASGTISYTSASPLGWSSAQPNTFAYVQYKSLPGTVEKSNISYQQPVGTIVSSTFLSTSSSSSSSTSSILQNVTGTFVETSKIKQGQFARDVGPATFAFSQTNGLSLGNPSGANLTIGIPLLSGAAVLGLGKAFEKNSSEFAYHLKTPTANVFLYIKNSTDYNQREVLISGTATVSSIISIALISSQTPSTCDMSPHKIVYPNSTLSFAPPCEGVQFGNIVWDWSGCMTNNPLYNNVTRIWSITVVGAFVCDPIALNGSGVISSNSATSVTCSLTTTSSNDIIIAGFSIFNIPAHAFSSISDSGGAGLTWTARVSALTGLAGQAYTYEYYAKSTGILTADPIVVSVASATFISVVCFGIANANYANPFDTNGGLPFTALSTPSCNPSCGATAPITFSTSNANDFIFALAGDSNVGRTFTVDAGFTIIQDEHVAGTGVDAAAAYLITTTTQSSVTVTMTRSTCPCAAPWEVIADAIQQAVPSIVQTKTCTATASAPTCAFTSNTLAGDTLVVVAGDIVNTAISSMTDTQLLTITVIVAKDTGTLGDVEMWWACDTLTAAAETVTVNYGVSVTSTIRLYELSPTTGCTTKSSTGSGSATTSASVTSYTPTNPSLVIGAADSTCQVACTVTGGNGYNLDSTTNTGAANTVDTEYKYNLGTAETTPFTFSINSAYNEVSVSFTVGPNTVTQPIKLTLQEAGAPTGTYTITGCSPTPATITDNGLVQNIVANPSCAMTITTPADGANSRYRFCDVCTSTTLIAVTTWTLANTCASGTCTERDNNTYYQLGNTYTATPSSPSTWDFADAIGLGGTYLGVTFSCPASANTATDCVASFPNTVIGGGVVTAPNKFLDYNTAVTFEPSLHGWTAQAPTSFTDTSGANTHNVNYIIPAATSSTTGIGNCQPGFCAGGNSTSTTATCNSLLGYVCISPSPFSGIPTYAILGALLVLVLVVAVLAKEHKIEFHGKA